eukprot:PhF_6_TR31743/c0_g1_i1/m.46728
MDAVTPCRNAVDPSLFDSPATSTSAFEALEEVVNSSFTSSVATPLPSTSRGPSVTSPTGLTVVTTPFKSAMEVGGSNNINPYKEGTCTPNPNKKFVNKDLVVTLVPASPGINTSNDVIRRKVALQQMGNNPMSPRGAVGGNGAAGSPSPQSPEGNGNTTLCGGNVEHMTERYRVPFLGKVFIVDVTRKKIVDDDEGGEHEDEGVSRQLIQSPAPDEAKLLQAQHYVHDGDPAELNTAMLSSLVISSFGGNLNLKHIHENHTTVGQGDELEEEEDFYSHMLHGLSADELNVIDHHGLHRGRDSP